MNIRVVACLVFAASLSLAGACSSGRGGDRAQSGDGAAGGTANEAGLTNEAAAGEAATDGADTPDCQAACNNVASAACLVVQDSRECLAHCELELAEPTCVAEAAALTECTANAPVTCNADGVPEIGGCDAERQASTVCFACVPSTNDDACQACVKETCCDQQKAALGDRNLSDYSACSNACNADTTCLQSCEARYPTAARALAALRECAASCTNC